MPSLHARRSDRWNWRRRAKSISSSPPTAFEGQNLQDCDFLINYDIHWNPVRIIQRFGRIDRIGSPNSQIQLVNFWPNMELDEYLDLESRVSGRMVLLDISATGEENIIEFQAGNQMNDLEYRRAQLQKLQDAVIDLEDLSSGVSIADLTLNDFRSTSPDISAKTEGAARSASAWDLCRRRPSQGERRSGNSAGRHILVFAQWARRHSRSAEPGYPLSSSLCRSRFPDDGEDFTALYTGETGT